MANKYFQQFLYSKTRMLTCIQGTISIAADASVSNGTTTMPGAVITKTGTGEYTITLADAYNASIAVHATMEAATAVDLVPQIKSIDVSSAKTVVIRTLAGATATNPSAVCKIHVSIFMRNSSISY